MSLKKSPFFELRSGSVDTLLFVVKSNDIEALRAELVKRFDATPEFFADDAVAIDVRRLADGEQVPLDSLSQMLAEVRMRVFGVVAEPAQHEWVKVSGLPLLDARDARPTPEPESAPAPAPAAGAAEQPETPNEASQASPDEAAGGDAPPLERTTGYATLIVDKPLRSGQRIYAKGDLVVLAPVSHGAEVIAEGNIHIYAPLRGRALAGVHGNHDARIFCTCLEPELISIAGIYRTAEQPLPAEVFGKPVQVRLEQEKIMIEPLRLT